MLAASLPLPTAVNSKKEIMAFLVASDIEFDKKATKAQLLSLVEQEAAVDPVENIDKNNADIGSKEAMENNLDKLGEEVQEVQDFLVQIDPTLLKKVSEENSINSWTKLKSVEFPIWINQLGINMALKLVNALKVKFGDDYDSTARINVLDLSSLISDMVRMSFQDYEAKHIANTQSAPKGPSKVPSLPSVKPSVNTTKTVIPKAVVVADVRVRSNRKSARKPLKRPPMMFKKPMAPKLDEVKPIMKF